MKYVRLVALMGFLLVPAMAHAQTATPNSKFAMDQPAPDLATAQGYVYRQYADGGATGTVVVMTCSGTASPFTCTTLIGPFTPTTHTVQFSASNEAGESPKGASITFRMVIVPQAPGNGRVIP